MVLNSSIPPRIIKAASACIWRGGHVLLVRRGNDLGKGLWSLPGGKLEPGETESEAAARELLEETGITADFVGNIGTFRILLPEVEYAITCFAGRHVSGEARAASDAAALGWYLPDAITSLSLAQHTSAAVAASRRMLGL